MNNHFKQLIFKMAQLPRSDQHWVIKQLTPTQQEQFKQSQGDLLLVNARRFRKLRCPELPQNTSTLSLPHCCHDLKLYPPLFIAIILEQGGFVWGEEFLTTHLIENEIKQLQEVVGKLKKATKLLVFHHWQKQLSFQDQLEQIRG